MPQQFLIIMTIVNPKCSCHEQAKWDSVDTGRFAHSTFPDVTLRPWFEGKKEERSFVKGFIWTLLCSIASRYRFRIVEDLMCVCADNYETVDLLIWHCERFRLEKHRLIGALAALNVSIGIPIRDLCALKKWCAVKCCLDFLGPFSCI
jgi:hypothetical protein